MKLLIDNQLPEALGRFLTGQGCECRHVRHIGLRMASDEAIWNHARTHGLTIVTMDEDFAALSAQQGPPSPQIIWVRLGNIRKTALIEAFSSVLEEIRTALARGDKVIEIR